MEQNDNEFKTTEAIFANILADVELGKNLEIHLVDLMGTLESLIPKITAGHKKGIDASSFERLAIVLMQLTNKIRFKLNVVEGTELPLLMPDTLSNLVQIYLDINDVKNFDYHKATLIYDIDNLNRIIDHKQPTEETKQICIKLRDTYQQLLTKI